MTDLFVLVCDVYCDFVTFPFGTLGQVWYFMVLIPDPCCLAYFYLYQVFVDMFSLNPDKISYFGETRGHIYNPFCGMREPPKKMFGMYIFEEREDRLLHK